MCQDVPLMPPPCGHRCGLKGGHVAVVLSKFKRFFCHYIFLEGSAPEARAKAVVTRIPKSSYCRMVGVTYRVCLGYNDSTSLSFPVGVAVRPGPAGAADGLPVTRSQSWSRTHDRYTILASLDSSTRLAIPAPWFDGSAHRSQPVCGLAIFL